MLYFGDFSSTLPCTPPYCRRSAGRADHRMKNRGSSCRGSPEKQVRGIEPPCSAWEADILPLNYTCISERDYSRSPDWLQAPISKKSEKDCRPNVPGFASGCTGKRAQKAVPSPGVWIALGRILSHCPARSPVFGCLGTTWTGIKTPRSPGKRAVFRPEKC